MIGFLLILLFIVIFGAVQSVMYLKYNTTPATEGYLSGTDQANLIDELESYGLYNISLSGTTVSEVDYGDRIYLCISGTYDDNILAFAGGISKITENPVNIVINRQTTAKQ